MGIDQPDVHQPATWEANLLSGVQLLAVLFLTIVSGLLLSGCGPSFLPPTPIQTLTPTANFTPIPSSTQARLPKPTVACRLGFGWYHVPQSDPGEPMDPIRARSFVGLAVPPFPVGVEQEFGFANAHGEIPGWAIVYDLLLVRQENTRMLWLGIIYYNLEESAEPHYRIYDSIPVPASGPNDVLIAFSCLHRGEHDTKLIVLATCTPEGPVTDIHFAWRIDPSNATLLPTSTKDIVCPRDIAW